MKKPVNTGMTRSEAEKALESSLDTQRLPSLKELVANRDNVIRNWSLGPEKTSIENNGNPEYWKELGRIWNVSEKEARTRLCANCEYYDNTPGVQAKMMSVPNDKFDRDGGGRGFCVKFDFICHNLRVCQAWEEKPFDQSGD